MSAEPEVERRPSRRVKHVGEDLFYLLILFTAANNGTQGQSQAQRVPPGHRARARVRVGVGRWGWPGLGEGVNCERLEYTLRVTPRVLRAGFF